MHILQTAHAIRSAKIPLKWQMNDVTRMGTAVNKFQMDVISVTIGSNLGMAMLPLNNLRIVIPAAIIRKMIASATAKAEVCLNESASTKSMSHSYQTSL